MLKYLQAQNKLAAGNAVFIIKANEPLAIAKVVQFKEGAEFELFKASRSIRNTAFVPGYKMALILWDVQADKPSANAFDDLQGMANFYYEHTIGPNVSYHKRYKIG